MGDRSRLPETGERVPRWAKGVVKNVKEFARRHPVAFKILRSATVGFTGSVAAVAAPASKPKAASTAAIDEEAAAKEPSSSLLSAFMEGAIPLETLSSHDQQTLANLIEEAEGGEYFYILEDTFGWDREQIRDAHGNHPDLASYLNESEVGCTNSELGLLPDGSRDDS